MRNALLIGVAVLFLAASVLVDFASHILSMGSDLLLIGGAVFPFYLVWLDMRSKIARLTAENASLRLGGK